MLRLFANITVFQRLLFRMLDIYAKHQISIGWKGVYGATAHLVPVLYVHLGRDSVAYKFIYRHTNKTISQYLI